MPILAHEPIGNPPTGGKELATRFTRVPGGRIGLRRRRFRSPGSRTDERRHEPNAEQFQTVSQCSLSAFVCSVLIMLRMMVRVSSAV
jgi:hypothetical protein